MPKYLVNLGMAVTVEAKDELEALIQARGMVSDEMTVFHSQVQPIIDPATFVPDAAPPLT